MGLFYVQALHSDQWLICFFSPMGMTSEVDTPNDSLMISATLRSVQSGHSVQIDLKEVLRGSATQLASWTPLACPLATLLGSRSGEHAKNRCGHLQRICSLTQEVQTAGKTWILDCGFEK